MACLTVGSMLGKKNKPTSRHVLSHLVRFLLSAPQCNPSWLSGYSGISGRKMCAHVSESQQLMWEIFYHYENIQVTFKIFLWNFTFCIYIGGF